MEGRWTLSDKLPDNLLAVKMAHRVGGLSLDVSFALRRPWTVLFGPSGSGKTTVLRAIAGFVRPDMGRIVYGPMERVLASTEERVFVPAHLRPVRSAAQAARLFPHRTVRENVAYGVGSEDGQVLEDVLGLMRLTTLADRRTEELSGGSGSGCRWLERWLRRWGMTVWIRRCFCWMSLLPGWMEFSGMSWRWLCGTGWGGGRCRCCRCRMMWGSAFCWGRRSCGWRRVR